MNLIRNGARALNWLMEEPYPRGRPLGQRIVGFPLWAVVALTVVAVVWAVILGALYSWGLIYQWRPAVAIIILVIAVGWVSYNAGRENGMRAGARAERKRRKAAAKSKHATEIDGE